MNALARFAIGLDVRRDLSRAARDWALRSREGVRFVETRTAVIRVRDCGTGPQSIVFAADPPNVIEHYDEVFATFARAGYRVVCVELPGFGFSVARRRESFSFDGLAAAVEEALLRLELERTTLVFPCVAGFVALQLAANDALVGRVVVPQMPSWSQLRLWLERVDRNRLLRTPVVGQTLMKLRKASVTDRWYAAAAGTAAERAALGRVTHLAFAQGACFCLASMFQALDRMPEWRPPKVRQPGLVLWGGQDKSHRRTDVRSGLEYFENAHLHELPLAGHFPDLQDPQGLLRLLAASPTAR